MNMRKNDNKNFGLSQELFDFSDLVLKNRFAKALARGDLPGASVKGSRGASRMTPCRASSARSARVQSGTKMASE